MVIMMMVMMGSTMKAHTQKASSCYIWSRVSNPPRIAIPISSV